MSIKGQWIDKDGNTCYGVKPEPVKSQKEQPAKKVNKTAKKG